MVVGYSFRAHSTLAMFVQTMPELEDTLHGLVLMGTAPDATWQQKFAITIL